MTYCGFSGLDEADPAGSEDVQETFAAVADEPLGRHVHQSQRSAPKPREDGGLLIRRERTVIAGRGHTVADKRVDLVLHQRDQGRYHDGQTIADERRGLEAERFPAASRKDDDGIVAGEDGGHRFTLQRPERCITPVALQHVRERSVVRYDRIHGWRPW